MLFPRKRDKPENDNKTESSFLIVEGELYV